MTTPLSFLSEPHAHEVMNAHKLVYFITRNTLPTSIIHLISHNHSARNTYPQALFVCNPASYTDVLKKMIHRNISIPPVLSSGHYHCRTAPVSHHTIVLNPISHAYLLLCMMASSNGNIFRVTGPLWGEFTGHRWIPLIRPVMQSFDMFLDLH